MKYTISREQCSGWPSGYCWVLRDGDRLELHNPSHAAAVRAINLLTRFAMPDLKVRIIGGYIDHESRRQ